MTGFYESAGDPNYVYTPIAKEEADRAEQEADRAQAAADSISGLEVDLNAAVVSASGSADAAALSASEAAASELASGDSETAAVQAASDAATSASESAVSAGQALSSASSAASSASSASSSAGSASASKTAAETAESNAASSASNAAVSETNAATSAQEAADEVASIDKVYLKSGRKNYIINGNFGIWQRSTSFTGVPGGSYYLCDRFNISLSGSGISASFQRSDFAAGQTEVPSNPSYYLSCALTTGTYTAVTLNHPVEDVRSLAGEEVAYSFWAKANQAENVTVALGQDFGTGGSPTVTTVLDIKAITTGWQKFEGTVTLPSISGKTIGAGSFLGLVFVLPNVTGFIFDIAQVQLEKGTYATDFEYRPIAEELALCQRYFEVTSSALVGCGTIAGMNSNIYYQYKATKRAIPSITLASGSIGSLVGSGVSGFGLSVASSQSIIAAGTHIDSEL